MRTLAVLVPLLICAGLASAQIPTSGNVFFGYSYFNSNLNADRNSLNGWEGTVEGKVLPHIAIVADFSGHYGSESFNACNGFDCVLINTDVSHHNYLFGPRVSLSVGKLRPFAEILIGASHVSAQVLGSDTSFATGVGGGVDYRLLKLIAWRFQADYIHDSLFGATQSNVRVSTGIVLRI
jgi:hypothetical protein